MSAVQTHLRQKFTCISNLAALAIGFYTFDTTLLFVYPSQLVASFVEGNQVQHQQAITLGIQFPQNIP